MTETSALVEALRWQANACRALGSPFTGGLLDLVADGALGPLDDLFAEWRDGDLAIHIRDATQLRLTGALHHLARTGAAPALAAQYPEARPDTDWPALTDAARAALESHRTAVIAFMASPPQTNEVGRSFCLAPGFMQVARQFGLPLRIFEIGGSAGLNLRWDHYGYDFAGQSWGDPTSLVMLDNDWRGAAPDQHPVSVVERSGCDQSPVDVSDDETSLRLQAYVWPDQRVRLARLRGAIAVARAVPAPLDKADAAAWVAERFAPRAGTASVLFHSVMWQYMPDTTQAAVRAAIEDAGAVASPDSPVAWLRMEPSPDSAGHPMELRLTTWPGGEERLLATTHPHGAWVNWL